MFVKLSPDPDWVPNPIFSARLKIVPSGETKNKDKSDTQVWFMLTRTSMSLMVFTSLMKIEELVYPILTLWLLITSLLMGEQPLV